jgi:hypothetical protein
VGKERRPKQIGVRDDILKLITSEEADEVTQLMSKIYIGLIHAPAEWWESNDTIRVRGDRREEVSATALVGLVNYLRVTPEAMQKALEWMQKKEIITYLEHEGGREIEISLAGLYFPE